MYNKKILNQATANLGKAKTPVKKPDIITDPMGQWKYPGQNTRIPGNDITMEGVPYPVWAQPNVGPGAMMQPGVDYQFPGADYVDEFPMAKKGGALPKLPNKKNSKAYSRSLTATNKLFAQNVLTRSRKKKIFDPNSKYYQDGGMQQKSEYIELDLTPEEIEQYRKGGYIIEELSQAQDSRNLQAFAEGGIYGNPIKDLINDPVKDLTGKPVASLTSQEREDIENTYLKFSGTPMPKDAYLTQDMYDTFRTTGQVHGYESPIDNNIGVGTQATIPPKSADRLAYMIQDPKNPYAKSQWVDRTAFDKHQGPKTTMKLSDEGQPIKGGTAGEYYNNYVKTFQDGGYIVEDTSVPQLTQAQKGLTISDPKEYAFRKGMYDDSLNLYKAYQMQDKLMGPGSYKTKDKYKWNTAELKEGRRKQMMPGLSYPVARDFQSEADQFKDGYHPWTARKEDKQLLNYYKKLGFKPNQIMYHSSPDIVSDKIKAVGSYFDGNAISPIYKKPVQAIYKPGETLLDLNESLISQKRPQENAMVLPIRPVEKLQINNLEQKQLEINPLSTKVNQYNPTKTAYRSQTVLEPDPNRPGKYKTKELRQVPYATTKMYRQGDVWEDEHAPRVIWIDEQGNEVEADPRKNSVAQSLPFQQGGYIDAELTPKEIEWYRSQGYQIEDIN